MDIIRHPDGTLTVPVAPDRHAELADAEERTITLHPGEGGYVEALAERNRVSFGGAGRDFVSLDITRDPLPRVDLVVCRDVLVHLKNRHILAALANFRRSGSRYLLATTFPGATSNVDGPLGGWRPTDLVRPPFSLGEPLARVSEAEDVEDPRYRDKSLGLWRLGAVAGAEAR